MKKYFVITIALLLTLTHMHVLPMENDDIKLFEKFKTLTIQKFSQQKSALHNRYKNKNIVDPRKLRDGIIEIETLIVTAPTKNLYSEEIRGLQKIQTQLRNKLDKLLGPLNSAQKLLLGLLSVTENDKPIGIEELLGDEDIDICPHALGVYIPADELLKRTSFGWFVRSSPKQILESNTMVAKYMLGSN